MVLTDKWIFLRGESWAGSEKRELVAPSINQVCGTSGCDNDSEQYQCSDSSNPNWPDPIRPRAAPCSGQL